MSEGTLKDKKRYIESANKAEIKYGLPKNILVGLIGAESNYNPNAKSKAGALGLAQFMPNTTKEYGIDPLNPEQAIDAAGKYLQKSFKKFGNIEDALRSYNMGVGGLQQVKQGKKKLPKETADYVGRVYKNAGIKNTIGNIKVKTPTAYTSEPPQEPITNTLNYFDKPTEISNFVESPKKEEKETDVVDAYVKKVEEQTKEYNFLDALKEMQQQDYSHLLPQEQEQTQAIPQTNYMQQYEQISQFVENPIAQQGGTWQEQLKRVQQEKAQNHIRPTLTVADLIAEKKLRDKNIGNETVQSQKDNTRVGNNFRIELISKVSRNKTDREIAEERKYVREQDAKSPVNTDFFNPDSHTRENWATGSSGLESEFRVSDEPNFFDDYLNPANMIGGMGASLGSAPLRAQQEDSYMPYVTALGAPLAVGAMAGLGTQNTGQFVNNLANPLAGFGLKDRALDAYRIGKYVVQNPKQIVEEAIKATKRLPNELEQVYHTFSDRNKPLYKIGSDNLENALESKIKNLQTEEGFSRLINQELEITKKLNPYGTEKELLEKANKNANARIDELSQTENLNKSFLNAKLENPNINVNPFLDFGIPRNNAHFQGNYNSTINLDRDFLKKINKDFVLDEGAVKPGKIAIGREYAEDIGVFDHEINHALQNGRQTKIDNDIIEHFRNLENRKGGLVSKKRSSDADEATLSYLLTGSKGKEPSSFLAEARQAMLNKNLIKDIYEPITPEIIEKSMQYFSKNPIKNKYTKISSTRIFDIANKNSAEFLANQMNKLPVIAPIVGASYLATQGENKQQGGQQNYTQNELAFLSEVQGIPVSSRGMYDYPKQEVIVPTKDGRITMKNIDYLIKGTDEYGNSQIMHPNKEYKFKGKIIHEIPLFKK